MIAKLLLAVAVLFVPMIKPKVPPVKVAPVPVVGKVDPDHGWSDDITYVRLEGVGFTNDGITNDTEFYFGTLRAELIRVASDTEVIVQVPEGGTAGSTVDVRVVFGTKTDKVRPEKTLAKAFSFRAHKR